MSRIVGNHVSLEMLALWLLELTLSFGLAYALLNTGPYGHAAANHAIVLALTAGLTASAIGLYRPEVFRRTRSMLVNTALGGLVAFPAAWAVSLALGLDAGRLVGHDALWPLKLVMTWIMALFATRLLFLAAVRSNLFVRRVAVLGPVNSVAGTAAVVRRAHRGFIEIVDTAHAMQPQLGAAALRDAGIRDVVASRAAYDALTHDARAAFKAAGITLETEAQFWERCLKRVDVAHLDADWAAVASAVRTGRVEAFVNRAGDIAISLALLVFTLPLMLLVALLVRLDSPGPVLYRQERVGLGGHAFTLLKFRSMRADAEARGPAWAKQRDPRVTRVGSFMRRTRIDELPQLLNILRGQMSFIGPRPERPHFVEQLAEVIPFYRERARVKPGLTGWAQVNFPYGASVEDARGKLSYDLYYAKHRSLLLDLAILFATVRVILFQEGSR